LIATFRCVIYLQYLAIGAIHSVASDPSNLV